MARLKEHSLFEQRLKKAKEQLTRLDNALFWPFVTLLLVGVVMLWAGQTKIGVACWVLVMLLALVKLYVTKTRNVVSNAWLRESLRQDSRSPVLILRSFDTQGSAYRPPRAVGKALLSGESYFDDIGLASLGPLIAIGTGARSAQPANAPDVLYLHTSDKDWFKVFELASKAARGIICAPGDSPGSIRELCTLCQSQMVTKIVFFMPPTPAKAHGLAAMNARFSPFLDPGKVRKKWTEVRESLREQGLRLPEYHSAGQLFILENAERVISSLPLDAGPDLYLKELAEHIEELFGRMPMSPGCPISELLQKTQPFEVPMRGTWLYRILCKPGMQPAS
jgi:hypothetical protein